MAKHAAQPAPYALDQRLAADSHPLHALELIDLQAAQRQQLTAEIDVGLRLLREVFRPHKLNVAALGNLVPQLHARRRWRSPWPAPGLTCAAA